MQGHIKIFQANVARTPEAHDIALNLAHAEGSDLILLQEPWTTILDNKCLTKCHPAYDTYSPTEEWEEARPRTMTYVLKSKGLDAEQLRPAATADVLWLVVAGLVIVNVYRVPQTDEVVNILETWTVPPANTFIARDFNAVYLIWQAGARPTNKAARIAR